LASSDFSRSPPPCAGFPFHVLVFCAAATVAARVLVLLRSQRHTVGRAFSSASSLQFLLIRGSIARRGQTSLLPWLLASSSSLYRLDLRFSFSRAGRCRRLQSLSALALLVCRCALIRRLCCACAPAQTEVSGRGCRFCSKVALNQYCCC
jgi:hypothetical protein